MRMRKSRLSKEKQERLMGHFVSGSTARCASELVNMNKNTATYIFHLVLQFFLTLLIVFNLLAYGPNFYSFLLSLLTIRLIIVQTYQNSEMLDIF